MTSRRLFFKQMLGSMAAAVDELRGIPQMKLSDIGRLPEDQIKRLLPRVTADLFLRESALWRKKDADMVRVCPLTPVEALIYPEFTGHHTIDAIASRIAETHDMDDDTAFRATKDLFVKLVDRHLCRPVNSL